MKIDMSPFYYLVERGVDPVSAYQRTYKNIMREIEFRTWYRGQPLGDAGAAGPLRWSGCYFLALYPCKPRLVVSAAVALQPALVSGSRGWMLLVAGT